MNTLSPSFLRFFPLPIAALVAGAGVVHAQPVVSSLELIAPFGFGTTSVEGLNNSGQVLVTGDGNGWKPIVWTAGGGFAEITDTLSGGSGAIHVGGINDAGQVVGSVNNGAQGFVWSAGTMTEITYPVSGDLITPRAINNSGVVVSEVIAGEPQFLFKSTGGASVTLQADEYASPSVTAINNAGQSVGSAYDNGTTRATLWDAEGNATVVPVPNANSESYAYSINDNGVVVGSYTNLVLGFMDVQTAFIWDGETAINLGAALGADSMQTTIAYDVNDFGHVVGLAYGGFLYMDGVGYDLDELAADFMGEMDVTSGFLSLNQAYHINNFGQIVGTGTYYDFDTGQTYDMGFMLSLEGYHVPEPSATAALAGLAALGVVALRRRRRA